MKKHTEKPPIDELFDRKLGNMSLPTSADGFDRLQARMNQQKPETRLVFWRNPSVQQYMAAAACLAIVCLFGWLYWPSRVTIETGHDEVAVAKKTVEQTNVQDQRQSDDLSQPGFNENKPALSLESDTPQVASNNASSIMKKPLQEAKTNRSITVTPGRFNDVSGTTPSTRQETAVAQTKPVGNKENTNAPTTVIATPVEPVIKEQVAENKPVAKPSPAAERVLEVTIAEPPALVAARQEVKAIVEEKAVLAQTAKVEKEAKGSLWQQVKRFKEGEVFARQDNINNEDRGLLERAYSGLKHSLDKDKATKQ